MSNGDTLQSTLLVSEVGEEGTLGLDVLDVSTVLDASLLGLEVEVLLLVDVGETPLLGDDDLLSTGELVSRSPESLENDGLVALLASDGKDDLTDVDSSDTTVRLSPSTSHTLLKPIGSGTGQHLVDSDDVEGVGPDPQVERVLSRGLDDVLVAANSGSFQSLGRDLLVFVRDQVGAEGEVIDGSPLSAQVEDPDLGVGDTSVVPRLGVRLVLTVTVATSRTTTHLDYSAGRTR